jgi:hypothetical protein
MPIYFPSNNSSPMFQDLIDESHFNLKLVHKILTTKMEWNAPNNNPFVSLGKLR